MVPLSKYRCSYPLLEQQYYSYWEWSIISMRIISAAAQKNSFSSSRKKEKGRGGRYPSLVQKATFPSVIYRFHQESVAARCDETGRDGTRPFFVGPARRGNGAQPTLRTHSSTERLETARRLLSHALWMIHERDPTARPTWPAFVKIVDFPRLWDRVSENRGIHRAFRFFGVELRNSRNFERYSFDVKK